MKRGIYIRGDLATRLWAKVAGPWNTPGVGEDDCWLWTGGKAPARRPKGLPQHKPYKVYGRIRDESNRHIGPHRAALLVTYGPSDNESDVASHFRCDVSLCCNPSHLRWETQQANIIDAIEKGRLRNTSGRFESTGRVAA